MLYIPIFAVVSHYFHRRSALAMMIVSSGSSLGAVLHPIMLNRLLNVSGLSFGDAVRASAALLTGLLFIACLLMRTRLPPPRAVPHIGRAVKRFARDGAYVAAGFG